MSPEDRFEDLGNGHRRTDPARFEDEARLLDEPDAPPRRPEMPQRGHRYAWLVGILMVMGVGVLLFTTAIPNAGRGLKGLKPGTIVPDFAAPVVTGDKEGDANLCQRTSECNERIGRVPACTVRGDGIFNVCDARKRPLVLTFVFDKGADCNPQVDRVQRMKDRLPGVNFAVVYFSKSDRPEVAAIVRRRNWKMPVVYVRDQAVVNLYGVGGCPTTVFAFKGGRVLRTVLGPISEGGLREQALTLLRGSGGRAGG